MKLRNLFISVIVMTIFLSGCNFISLDDVRNSSESKESHEKSNKNGESSSNKKSNHNKQNGDHRSVNQGEQLTINQAKTIAYEKLQKENQAFFNKSDLIHIKSKSDENQYYIETPFYGENEASKAYVIVDKNKGTIIAYDALMSAPDIAVDLGDTVSPKLYNGAVKFYNTFSKQANDKKIEYSSEEVSVEQYRKVTGLIEKSKNKQMNKSQPKNNYELDSSNNKNINDNNKQKPSGKNDNEKSTRSKELKNETDKVQKTQQVPETQETQETQQTQQTQQIPEKDENGENKEAPVEKTQEERTNEKPKKEERPSETTSDENSTEPATQERSKETE